MVSDGPTRPLRGESGCRDTRAVRLDPNDRLRHLIARSTSGYTPTEGQRGQARGAPEAVPIDIRTCLLSTSGQACRRAGAELSICG